MTHLTPFEVLTAINHAQHRLGCKFTSEEIESGGLSAGGLSGLMIDADFDLETTISLLNTNPSLLSCTP